jgi:hypothetical protein
MDIKSMDRSAPKWNNLGEIFWFYGKEITDRPESRLALEQEMHQELAAFYAAQPAVVAYRPSLSERGFWEWLQIIGFILFIAFVAFNDEGTSTGLSCTPHPMGGCMEEDY